MDRYHYDILEEYQKRLESIQEEMQEYQETGVRFADYTQYQKELYKKATGDLYYIIDYINMITSEMYSESIPCSAIQRVADGSFVDDSMFPPPLSKYDIRLYSFKAVLYEIIGGKIVTREIDFDESYTENINRTVIEAEMFCKTCIAQNLKAFIMFQLKYLETDVLLYNFDKRIDEHRKKDSFKVRFPYTVTIRWIKTIYDALSDEDKKVWSALCLKELQDKYSSKWTNLLRQVMAKDNNIWDPIEMYFDFQNTHQHDYDEHIRIYKRWRFKLENL